MHFQQLDRIYQNAYMAYEGTQVTKYLPCRWIEDYS